MGTPYFHNALKAMGVRKKELTQIQNSSYDTSYRVSKGPWAGLIAHVANFDADDTMDVLFQGKFMREAWITLGIFCRSDDIVEDFDLGVLDYRRFRLNRPDRLLRAFEAAIAAKQRGGREAPISVEERDDAGQSPPLPPPPPPPCPPSPATPPRLWAFPIRLWNKLMHAIHGNGPPKRKVKPARTRGGTVVGRVHRRF